MRRPCATCSPRSEPPSRPAVEVLDDMGNVTAEAATSWWRILPQQLRPARRSGLRAVLSAGANYFLPDEHEF